MRAPAWIRSEFANRKSPRIGGLLLELARPKRFELLTPWFVARYSIQLSYGRGGTDYSKRYTAPSVQYEETP